MKLVTYYCIDEHGNQGITFRYLVRNPEEAYSLFQKDLENAGRMYTVTDMFEDELSIGEVVSYLDELWKSKADITGVDSVTEFICNVAKLEYLRDDVSIFPTYLQLNITDKKKAKALYEMERERLERCFGRGSDDIRVIVLSSEMVGIRKAPHDIVYNHILNEKEKQHFEGNHGSFLDEMYARLGNRDPQPSDFYGHSPSVGDIFLIMKGNKIDAYSVAIFGFDKENDLSCVITPEQHRASVIGLTVKEEFELLSSIRMYAASSGIKELIDVVETETKGRFDFLLDDYLFSFNLAEVRDIGQKYQAVLSLLHDQYMSHCFDVELVQGPYDGMFFIKQSVIKAVMPVITNDEDLTAYNGMYIVAGDKIRAIIRKQLSSVAEHEDLIGSKDNRFPETVSD